MPPADYFREMSNADLAVIDTTMRYDKRMKSVHRTVVSGRDGAPLYMTVPVSTPGTSRCTWDEVSVSAHGHWWSVQRQTMATFYGATPFFDFYRHDLFPFLSESAVGRHITDLDIDLILTIRRLAGIDTPLSVTLDPRLTTDRDVEIKDLRNHDFYARPDTRSAIDALFHQGKL